MKHTTHIIVAALTMLALSASLQARDDQPRIYINPGHGGWGPDDRPFATISHPATSTGRPDTCGFYESNNSYWCNEEGNDRQWSNFKMNLDPALVKPYINGSILGDIVTYLVFTMAGAEMWQRAFAAKDRSSAKKGMFLGTSVYGVTIILVYFMGIIGHQVLGEGITNTDSVVPSLAIRVLPAGLTGLALAGLLSVIMSTADSYLLVSVQTCVHDIGKTINPYLTEKKEILYSRVFSIILPLGALVIALYIQNAYDILMFSWSFYAAACGLPCFAALFWKKATTAGIISGMIAGFVVCVGWKLAGLPFGLGAAVPGAIACAVFLLCVSLATYKRHATEFLN